MAGEVAAQSLGDPTQPPVAVLAPVVQGVSVGGTAEAPVLQSVLVSPAPGGRRLAVINGEVVQIGARIGDAVVTHIGDTQVVLRRGKATQVLKLFPQDPGATVVKSSMTTISAGAHAESKPAGAAGKGLERKAEGRGEGKPVGAPGVRPEILPEIKPGARPESRPAGKNDVKPETRPSGSIALLSSPAQIRHFQSAKTFS